MKVTPIKTTPPPQPPPKLNGFTVELTEREGFILSRVLGKHSTQALLEIANDVNDEPSLGNALISPKITYQEAASFLSLYFKLNDAFPNRAK